MTGDTSEGRIPVVAVGYVPPVVRRVSTSSGAVQMLVAPGTGPEVRAGDLLAAANRVSSTTRRDRQRAVVAFARLTGPLLVGAPQALRHQYFGSPGPEPSAGLAGLVSVLPKEQMFQEPVRLYEAVADEIAAIHAARRVKAADISRFARALHVEKTLNPAFAATADALQTLRLRRKDAEIVRTIEGFVEGSELLPFPFFTRGRSRILQGMLLKAGGSLLGPVSMTALSPMACENQVTGTGMKITTRSPLVAMALAAFLLWQKPAEGFVACAGCGVPMLRSRAGQRYHDTRCRERAKKQRQRAPKREL